MFLEQDTRTQNICDTFEPDTASSSFQKPVSEMNIASGIPCFIEHAKMDSKIYLYDDTIFLKNKVDRSYLVVLPLYICMKKIKKKILKKCPGSNLIMNTKTLCNTVNETR